MDWTTLSDIDLIEAIDSIDKLVAMGVPMNYTLGSLDGALHQESEMRIEEMLKDEAKARGQE